MQKLLETDMTEVTFHQEEALEEASLVVEEAGGGGGRNGRKISHKKVAILIWLLLKIKGDVLLIYSQ